MLLDVSPGEASCLFVFLAALLTAWNATANGFVWDDRSAVLSNADAQSSSLLDVFSHDFWGTHLQSAHSHKSYRPFTVLSFRLNYLLASGHSAWLYHFTNALVHAGCAVLVWTVADVLFRQHARRLGAASVRENPQDASPLAGDNGTTPVIEEKKGYCIGSLTAGLLFAVHPIHCDAVASIVGRADLLCTSLSLSAFLAYARGAKRRETEWRFVVLALVLTIAAGLCKELGFTNFALLVVYDLLRIGHYLNVDRKLTLMKKRVGVVFTVGIVAAVARVWINGEHRQMKWNILANNVVVQESRLTRALSYANLHAWYLWKLVWPRMLCFDYGYNTIPVIESATDPRNVYTLFAGSPVVGANQKSAVVSIDDEYRVCRLRNADWVSEQMLFKVAVDVVPTNVKVLSNQAKNLLNPDPQKALEYLRVAIAARNNHDEDLYLHGIRHLHKSAVLAPSHFQAPGFIGGEIFTHWMKTRLPYGEPSLEDLLASESVATATKFLDQAIACNSIYPTHFYNRGNIAYEIGDFDTAISFFRMTEVANSVIRDRKVDPELLVEASSIYNMLGICFKRKGDVGQALEMLRKGIALYPKETDLHVNAALILQEEGEALAADAQLKAGLIAATELFNLS
uniref:dolichyl-phosphate-mannose--protein mannosyltransferase n=1 Tax=Phytophthora ramorum TaxID=164328 RepID=H3GMR0_PHYRM